MWAAHSLAAIGIVLCGFALADLLLEGGHRPLPFVLEGSPFGTYAASTQLGLLTFAAGLALSLVGAILAFWWKSVAARFLIAGGAIQTFIWAIWSQDSTRPSGDMGAWISLLIFALPPFVLALLLVLISRNRRHTDAVAGASR
jgi:apolipoprotein N-acyltransferase